MTSNENKENKLPKILNIYSNSAFNLQLKARVFYNINIAALVAIILLTISSIYTQLIGTENKLDLHIIIPIIALFFVFSGCLILLVKGHFSISTHVFLISANLGVWYVMVFGSNNVPIIKLDTAVLILAIINSIPLFISKFRITIFIYVLANLLFLYFFISYFKDILGLNTSIVVDYFFDIAIALIFSGVAAFQIVRINNKALDKVEYDYEKRLYAEKELKKSEELRRNVFESSKVPIIVMESDSFKYIDINPAGIKVYGYRNKDEVLGKTPLDVSAQYQYDGALSEKKAIHYINEAINHGSVTFDWLHQRPNGEFWDAEVHLLSFKSGDKTLLQFSLIDITEKKKAEKALIASQKLFQTLAEVSPVGIFRTRPDGYTTYVNPKWCELSGLKFDEAIGNDWLRAVHPEDRNALNVKWETDSNEGVKSIAEYRFIKPNGEIVWVLGNAVPEMENDEISGYIGTITDITEIKKINKELLSSELRYRGIFENSQVGIYQTTPAGEILQANPALLNMLGYNSIKELSNRNIEKDDVFLNKTRVNFINTIEKYGFVKDFESEWLKSNGETLIIRENAHAVKDAKGKTKYYEGFVVDITERKKTMKALKESEEKYREMAELLPVVIWESDLKGNCTYTNKVGLKVHSYTYDDLIKGINVLDLIIPEQKQRAKETLKRRLQGILSTGDEYLAVRKDGTRFPVKIFTSVVYKEDKPVGFRGVTVDITEAKNAERELKESEEKYRTIIEAFPDIIMISDLNKNIIFGNSALEKLTGITSKDYKNPNRKARIHPEDMDIVQNALKDLLNGDEAHTDIIENRFIDHWGNIHWFSGIMSKLKINGEIYIQTISRDITDKKIIEQELEKHREHLEFLVKERTEELATTNEELSSTNEELLQQREELEAVLMNLQNTQKQLIEAEKMASLGVLASGVAHEINNPLNFIKGGAFGIEQYINDNLKEHKTDLEPLIEGINIGIDRAANIVTSLNHYSRKNDAKIIECDIHEIIDNCLVILQNQIKNRIDININYTIKKYKFLGNEGKLHQAMLNILSNAVQSISGKGQISIQTKIEKKVFIIFISDSGCGIKEKNLSKIFDPFYTTKEAGDGTGLGLSITYNIIKDHKGSIEVSSEENNGTEFKIVLPL